MSIPILAVRPEQIDEIAQNLGSPELRIICKKYHLLTYSYQIPGIPEDIFGLKVRHKGLCLSSAIVPGVVAATEAQIDVFRGCPAWNPPAFICPPADAWTLPLFKEWTGHWLDYEGEYFSISPDLFCFKGEDGSVLSYDRHRSNAQFKFTAFDMVETLAPTPGEACGTPGASRTYPYQQSEFRKSISGDYASLALEAISIPFTPPEPGEKEMILAKAVEGIPRYEIKGYSPFQLRAAIVHSRLLKLLGPEGPLCGYGIER